MTLDREEVFGWARSQDLEVLGAVSSLIFDPVVSRQIRPNLTLSDYLAIELPYLKRCLIEDPPGRFADSRWQAGSQVGAWITDIWREERFRSAVAVFEEWLRDLYRATNDVDLKICIVQTVLEHIFELPGVPELFRAWTVDPLLATAYGEAMEWKTGLEEIERERGE